jgi:hypothetical protein
VSLSVRTSHNEIWGGGGGGQQILSGLYVLKIYSKSEKSFFDIFDRFYVLIDLKASGHASKKKVNFNRIHKIFDLLHKWNFFLFFKILKK